MSESVSWEPITNGTTICSGCSTVRRALEAAFGDFPIELEAAPDTFGILTALKLQSGDGDDNPYQRILDALEVHPRIRLNAHF